MPSRSNLDLRDKNGNRIGPRPTVGEADPETRRRAIQERLNERQAPPSRPRPAPATARQERHPDALKVARAANDLRYRGVRIDEAVDKNSK